MEENNNTNTNTKKAPIVAVRVARKDASATKQCLERLGILVKSLEVVHDNTQAQVIFPAQPNCGEDASLAVRFVGDRLAELGIEIVACEVGVEFVKSARQKKKEGENNQSMAAWLKGKLTEDEMTHVVSSFDVIGDCVVVEIPHELEHKEQLIAESIVATHKGVVCVCAPTGVHSGPFRVQPLRVVLGPQSSPIRANYRENNCHFVVDIDQVFFSPRLAAERLRISELVQPEEVVCALFAGVGPFPIVLAKHSQLSKVIAVELNPHAVSNMQCNVTNNLVSSRVDVVHADAVQYCLQNQRFCQRLVMPIPHDGVNGKLFLVECLPALVCGGVCHFYDVVSAKTPFETAWERIHSAVEGLFVVTKISQKRLRRIGVGFVQIVTDFRVEPVASET